MELIREESSFWIPISNLYLDESLKNLTSREFKTYLTITKIIKEVGPNTQKYFTNKKNLHKKVEEFYDISHQTFLKHIKKFDEIGILSQINNKTLDIGYSIADAKSGGYTAVELILLDYLIPNLDPNELKLYMAILRLLRGFNKKSASYSYSVMKTWSGIKNKAIYTDTRNSLQEKGLISSLYDVEAQKHVFKLNDISELLIKNHQSQCSEQLEKQQRKQDLNRVNCNAHTEKELHIKKYSSSEKKYNKKSSISQNSIQEQKEVHSSRLGERVISFISENYKTKHLSENQNIELLGSLIKDLEDFGSIKGEKVKSPMGYLSVDSGVNGGRVVDKVIERYYSRQESTKKENEAIDRFYMAMSHYYPERVSDVQDYKNNNLSLMKLKKIIIKAPSIAYFSDDFIFLPNYSAEEVHTSKDSLLKGNLDYDSLSLEEKLNMIASINITEETVVKNLKKLDFSDFCARYSAVIETKFIS